MDKAAAKSKTTRRRRKSKAQRKEDSIRIRVTEAQKKLISEAAAQVGLGVSSWLLSVGLRKAPKVIARAR
jgi:uncharacterized protein (DUF1778 family)